MNEQALWARRIRPWLQKLERAGAPIWWAKNHGSVYSRDRIDLEVFIQGVFITIELKNPSNPTDATEGQMRELRRLDKAGAITMLSHSEFDVKQLISSRLESKGWIHAELTEPYL